MTSRKRRSSHPAEPDPARAADDLGGISEITILPDGRVYVLGLSAAILEVLQRSGPWDGLASRRRTKQAKEPS